MNRRNLLLGLGTAATLSGAASVTGAAFADSVEPANADFRVVAQANVNVKGIANNADAGPNGTDNTTTDFVRDNGTGSGVNFSNITGSSDVNELPVAHSLGSTADDDLSVSLAFETDNATTLPAVLEIDNTGDTAVNTVGITFTESNGDSGFGEDVTTGTSTSTDDIYPSDVINAIQFVDQNGDQISTDSVSDDDPSQSSQTVNSTIDIPAGGSEQIGIRIQDDSEFDTSVSNAASGGSPFSSDSVENLSLIDAISVGSGADT